MSSWIREPSGIHRGWRTKWNLKDLINDDDDDVSGPTVARIARHFHDRLEDFRGLSCQGAFADDSDIESISDEFHTIGYVDGDEADVNEFNFVLNSLYDWADEQRIIIS